MESVGIFGRNPPANQECEEIDCAAGDLKVLGTKSVEAEGADDDRGKLWMDISQEAQ